MRPWKQPRGGLALLLILSVGAPRAARGQEPSARLQGGAARTGQQQLDGRLVRGSQVYESGQEDQAVEAFRELCQANPEDGKLWLAVTVYLSVDRQDYHRALEFAEGAHEIAPQVPEAWVLLGYCYIEIHELAQAEQLLRQGVKRFPKQASVIYTLASACGVQRKLQDAQNLFEQAVDLEPDNALYLFVTGENSLKLGRYDLAEKFYRRALGAKKRHPDAGWRLAEVLSYLGREPAAEKLFKRALKNLPSPNRERAAYQYAVFLCERKRFAEALPLLGEVLQANSNHAMAWNLQARSLKALGKNDEAAIAVEKYRDLRRREEQEEDRYLLDLIRQNLGRGSSSGAVPDGDSADGDRP